MQGEIGNGGAADSTARIKVIGVGGCGCNILKYIGRRNINRIQTIAIDTDEKSVKAANAHVRLLLGKRTSKGLGLDGDWELGA